MMTCLCHSVIMPGIQVLPGLFNTKLLLIQEFGCMSVVMTQTCDSFYIRQETARVLAQTNKPHIRPRVGGTYCEARLFKDLRKGIQQNFPLGGHQLISCHCHTKAMVHRLKLKLQSLV